MNTSLLFEIGKLAFSLLESHTAEGSKLSKDAAIAKSLLRIVEAGAEAYHQHMGEPLDPALVKPESLV